MINYKVLPLLSSLLLYFSAFSQVTITGNIDNYDGTSKLYYSNSWQGIYPKIDQVTSPNSNGKFIITLDNQPLGKVNISYKRFRATLFFNENAKLELDLNELDPDSFSISGSLKSINNYYYAASRVMNSPIIGVSGNGPSRFLSEIQSPERIVGALDSMIRKDIGVVSEKRPISLEKTYPEMLEIVSHHLENEIKSYYANVFLNAMFLKKQNQAIKTAKNDRDSVAIYDERWHSLIESFSKNIRKIIQPTPSSLYYNEFLRMHSYILQTYKDNEFYQPVSIDEDIYDKLVGYDSLLFNDSKSVLAYQLGYLNTFLASDLYYSPALLDITNQIRDENPDLPYWSLLESNINRMKKSIIAGGRKYRDAKIIKTNYTTFQDLINQFEGKYLYVDIWATSCLPCIQEFKYKDEVLKNLNPDGEILYISTDRISFDDRWKQSIKYNKLEGYHVRANNELIIDIWDEIGGFKGAIPRYVLIDQSGNIFNTEAASPSDIQALKRQIEEMRNTTISDKR